MRSFSTFLRIGTTFAYFHRLGKVFLSLQLLNMIESGFTILLSQFQHSYGYLIMPMSPVDVKCLNYFVYIFILNIER